MSSDVPFFEEKLFDRHGQLERWLGSVEAADDAIQSVAEKIVKSGDRPNASYLAAMLRNAAVDRVRSEMRRRGYEEAFASAAETVDDRSPDRLVAGTQALEALRGAIGRLSPTDRKIFVLACLEAKPRSEIAAVVGLKLSTVEKRLAKAKASCYRQVKDHLD